MNIDCEPALSALLAKIVATATSNFTADADGVTAVLTNVSSVAGLIAGMPAFGPSVPRGAWVESWTSNPNTITLSQVPTAPCTGGAFTTGFLTTGRRLKWWTDKTVQQPALFIRHLKDKVDWEGIGLGRKTVFADVWIYSNAGQDPDLAPDIVLNALVKCVETALCPDDWDDGRCTLDRTVFWARVEGESLYEPGDTSGQSIANIPVLLTLP